MMGPGRPAAECENEELVDEFESACRGKDHEFADDYRNEIVRRLESWKDDERDPDGLTVLTTVFDRNKFYPGRAIHLKGYDEDGFSINGSYLIRSVDLKKITVIN